MRHKAEFTLLGAKPTKFNDYDVTNIYVGLPLSDGNGHSTVQYTFGTSADYDKLKDLNLPVQVMLDYELVSTGKTQKTIVHGVEIVTKQPKQLPQS